MIAQEKASRIWSRQTTGLKQPGLGAGPENLGNKLAIIHELGEAWHPSVQLRNPAVSNTLGLQCQPRYRSKSEGSCQPDLEKVHTSMTRVMPAATLSVTKVTQSPSLACSIIECPRQEKPLQRSHQEQKEPKHTVGYNHLVQRHSEAGS